MLIDSSELRVAQDKLHMFLAIDRFTRCICVALLDAVTKLRGTAFLLGVVAAFP